MQRHALAAQLDVHMGGKHHLPTVALVSIKRSGIKLLDSPLALLRTMCARVLVTGR